MEFQSGPKFWRAVAAGRTAELHHPYADLIHQTQTTRMDVHLEDCNFVLTTTG